MFIGEMVLSHVSKSLGMKNVYSITYDKIWWAPDAGPDENIFVLQAMWFCAQSTCGFVLWAQYHIGAWDPLLIAGMFILAQTINKNKHQSVNISLQSHLISTIRNLLIKIITYLK